MCIIRIMSDFECFILKCIILISTHNLLEFTGLFSIKTRSQKHYDTERLYSLVNLFNSWKCNRPKEFVICNELVMPQLAFLFMEQSMRFGQGGHYCTLNVIIEHLWLYNMHAVFQPKCNVILSVISRTIKNQIKRWLLKWFF